MTGNEPVTLRPETATAYLERRGAFDPGEVTAASAEALGGGVSNRVIRVRSRDRCLVLKQPRSNLAVDDDWPADVSRIHNEAAAARAYTAVAREAGVSRPTAGVEPMGTDSGTGTWSISVPEVVFEDERDHVLAMACVPSTAETWKTELLAGTVDATIARALGRFLGLVHRSAADRPDLRKRFDDATPFEQLRVEPYHRTTAARNPNLADPILAEAERVLGVRDTLVHGDYSPKNVLVERSGRRAADPGNDAATPNDGIELATDTDPNSTVGSATEAEGGPTLWLIDFEVAHWGDPAFDTGFMLNHLFIKSVHNRTQQEAYLDAARAFWRAYDEIAGWDIERATARELAVLMLARVDGKSPVEYVDERTGELLREIARRALTGDVETIEEYAALTREVSS